MNRDLLELAERDLRTFCSGASLEFGMSFWRLDRQLPAVSGEAFAHFCRSVVCAIGFIALQPWAQNAGLRLERDRCDPNFWLPVFEGNRSMSAVANFFDIGRHAAIRLFSSGAYPNNVQPADVADRIRIVLDHGEQAIREVWK